MAPCTLQWLAGTPCSSISPSDPSPSRGSCLDFLNEQLGGGKQTRSPLQNEELKNSLCADLPGFCSHWTCHCLQLVPQ